MTHFFLSRLGQGLDYHVRRPHRCGFGVHSPFVYRLTRDLLRRCGKGVSGGTNLTERLAAWIPCREICRLPFQPGPGQKVRQPGGMLCGEGDLTRIDSSELLIDSGFWQERDVLVLHRIHASEQALQRWKALQRHPRVSVTIDLWNTGLVFFDKRLHRQQFVIFAPRRLRM